MPALGRLTWTPGALADVRSIRAHIAQDRPLAADRFADRLIAAAHLLSETPYIGRQTSRGRRELTTVPPYVIRYRVELDRIVMLEVRHGAREPDSP